LLSIRPLVRSLPRRTVDDLIAHVVVELVDGDGTVIVCIRGPCLQAFDQKVRELGPVGKRAAVAAIEDEDLTLREAAIHSTADERRFDCRSRQEPGFGVSQRQVEMSLLVLDAVPGEIQQQEIVPLSLIVEAGNRFPDRGAAFVQEGGHLIEVPDVCRLEHAIELPNVQVGCFQAAQTRVVVATVADDEGELASHERAADQRRRARVCTDASARSQRDPSMRSTAFRLKGFQSGRQKRLEFAQQALAPVPIFRARLASVTGTISPELLICFAFQGRARRRGRQPRSTA
jgi:hypothetical protein